MRPYAVLVLLILHNAEPSWERRVGRIGGLFVGLWAQPEIFAERNILGEEYLHVKFDLIIAKMCENFPTLNMTLDMLCIAYKKLLWSNSNLNFSNVPNLMTFVQIL
jgi:hypothetical protein